MASSPEETDKKAETTSMPNNRGGRLFVIALALAAISLAALTLVLRSR